MEVSSALSVLQGLCCIVHFCIQLVIQKCSIKIKPLPITSALRFDWPNKITFIWTLTTLLYITVLPSDRPVHSETPRPLPTLPRVPAIIVPPGKFGVALVRQQVLMGVSGGPGLTGFTSSSNVDGALVSPTTPIVAIGT